MNTSLQFLFFAAVLAAAQPALASGQAPLQCTSQDDTVLSLQPGDSGAATASLATAQGKTPLRGTFHNITQSVFAVVDQYDLTDAAGQAFEIQVSYHTQIGRGGCGRAGCPPVGSAGPHAAIHARLESGGVTQTFSCVQASDDPI